MSAQVLPFPATQAAIEAANETCSCGLKHEPGRLYYTSAEDPGKGRHVALSGPYATHDEALAWVDEDRRWAHEVDPRAPWYAYGTMSAPAGTDVLVVRS